ncbi:hypothetical protein [Pseudanabaena sp. FACHB-1998]|nr:hypothetical protein [Pseudanabaena sp. FACHB-1998]
MKAGVKHLLSFIGFIAVGILVRTQNQKQVAARSAATKKEIQ